MLYKLLGFEETGGEQARPNNLVVPPSEQVT